MSDAKLVVSQSEGVWTCGDCGKLRVMSQESGAGVFLCRYCFSTNGVPPTLTCPVCEGCGEVASNDPDLAKLRLGQWQPIETAPRDATPILVGLIADGRVWRASDAKFYGVGFYTLHGGQSCHWATHWTPLLDPPTEEPRP